MSSRGHLLVVLLLLIFCRPLISANLTLAEEMKDLIDKAGPVPDEILYPSKPINLEIDIKEKFRRFWLEKVLGYRVTYELDRGKACLSNQKVIRTSIELYNLENSLSMKGSFSDAEVTSPTGFLVVDKFLKREISRPGVDCFYGNYGTLLEGGIIYCKAHGTSLESREAIAQALGLELPSNHTKRNNMIVVLVLFICFLLLAFLVLYRFKRAKEKT